ncbi:Argininosuccinate lyase [hydrothermal vent metagenome]|uniref:Argininosuccinate lyase n=1 Tax=hydrothermal vent metagenome TaxID=652676 RepID=A0A1W1BNC2_9ZZZZ
MSNKKNIASARISAQSSDLLKALNDSLPFDKVLYAQDIEGSKAHAFMLAQQNIITQEDFEAIDRGLSQVLEEIESGLFTLDGGDEDIHMANERRLTEIIGDAGKRLHTARSRNDQVALDFRLFVQHNSKKISELILENIQTLILRAKESTDIMLPGMTHLQHAQPINFGYHLLAYASMLQRDYKRFISSFERNNLSPIGCAALAGTPHPISREITAQKLGFDEPTLNCLDTVSDRDFALEILFNISTMMMHISRLSEELILWSASEFKWITLSDRHATGSSIMPQKKNPDIPELLRGKTGRVNGNLVSLLTVMKGLPLAYNKDMQEDKEGVFDSVRTAILSLEVLNEMIADMKINRDKMEDACMIGHLSATDLADYLVREANLPFRDAYHITGNAVNLAETKNIDISELSLDDLQSIDKRIGEGAVELLDNRASMNARVSEGGTATIRTIEQIQKLEDWIDTL